MTHEFFVQASLRQRVADYFSNDCFAGYEPCYCLSEWVIHRKQVRIGNDLNAHLHDDLEVCCCDYECIWSFWVTGYMEVASTCAEEQELIRALLRCLLKQHLETREQSLSSAKTYLDELMSYLKMNLDFHALSSEWGEILTFFRKEFSKQGGTLPAVAWAEQVLSVIELTSTAYLQNESHPKLHNSLVSILYSSMTPRGIPYWARVFNEYLPMLKRRIPQRLTPR